MKTPEECKADYEAGNQERDHRGERLWLVTDITVYPPDELDRTTLFRCKTAEGPEIWALRHTDGTAHLQVEGFPERRDTLAEEFVQEMESLGRLEEGAWVWNKEKERG